PAGAYSVGIEVHTNYRDLLKPNRICLSLFATSVREVVEWELKESLHDDEKLENIIITIDSPVLEEPESRALINYLLTAPQYGGYFKFHSLGGSRFALEVDGRCPTQAAVHGMRVFVNTRER